MISCQLPVSQKVASNRTVVSHGFVKEPKSGAEGRNRTVTGLSTPRILSPVRLPISPPRQEWNAGSNAIAFFLGSQSGKRSLGALSVGNHE